MVSFTRLSLFARRLASKRAIGVAFVFGRGGLIGRVRFWAWAGGGRDVRERGRRTSSWARGSTGGLRRWAGRVCRHLRGSAVRVVPFLRSKSLLIWRGLTAKPLTLRLPPCCGRRRRGRQPCVRPAVTALRTFGGPDHQAPNGDVKYKQQARPHSSSGGPMSLTPTTQDGGISVDLRGVILDFCRRFLQRAGSAEANQGRACGNSGEYGHDQADGFATAARGAVWGSLAPGEH